MQQMFNDLCNEQKRGPARGFVVLSIFAETAIGIVQEHLFLLIGGDVMKNMLANPTSAAIGSFILSLPLGLLFIIFNLDIKPLTMLVTSWLTVNGSDVNGIGRLVLLGGLLLLPLSFVINLLTFLKSPQVKRKPHTASVIVGIIILMSILVSWGGLLVEEIHCLRGIRCD